MSATALTPVTAVSPYGAGPGPGVAEAAADTENGNSFANTGREYLVARNADEGEEVGEEVIEATDHTITVQGKEFTVPVGKSIVLGPFPTYCQYGTSVTVTADDATVMLAAYSAPTRNTALR
jgi:hypothetical protein